MDRHVLWLRRRIIGSVLKQASVTFGVVFALLALVLIWRSDLGAAVSIAISFLVAQVVAISWVVWAVRNNPLGYSFLKEYIDADHRFAICEDDEDPHEICAELLGFYPVVAVHDTAADPSPVFDLFQTADRVTTAMISRVSGAVSLVSRLDDGRLLLTDNRMVMPNEGLIVNLVDDKHPALLIAAHQTALGKLPIVACPEPLAVKVAARALQLEHRSYCELGAIFGSFLDLQPHNNRKARLVLRLDRADLLRLAFPKGTPAPSKPVTETNRAEPETAAVEPESQEPAVTAVAQGEPATPATDDGVEAAGLLESAVEGSVPDTQEVDANETAAGPGGYVSSSGEAISYFAPPAPDTLPIIRPSSEPHDDGRDPVAPAAVTDSGGESLAFRLAARSVVPSPVSEPIAPVSTEAVAALGIGEPEFGALEVPAAELPEAEEVRLQTIDDRVAGAEPPPLVVTPPMEIDIENLPTSESLVSPLPTEPAGVEWVALGDVEPAVTAAATNGAATNGAAANDAVPVGAAANGVAANGEAANGVAANGVAASDAATKGAPRPDVSVAVEVQPEAVIPVVQAPTVAPLPARIKSIRATQRCSTLPPAVYSAEVKPASPQANADAELVELTST